MQTSISPQLLSNPDIAEADAILRSCVHCGFCTATCPTYVLLGDELDSPRGRIYLIKEMLEQAKPATREVVKHIDRCLSCLACMTTCPSGVNYMHLVDHARERIEQTYKRPFADRAIRALLARDITEFLATLKLPQTVSPIPLTVAYHAACSLQHGQKVMHEPKELLSRSGFVVKDVPEGHLCCGSAVTYNILQPALAEQLRARKVANIELLEPDVIAAGNIGCITQLAAGTAIPVVHTVELLDWATGGPVPEPLAALAGSQAPAG